MSVIVTDARYRMSLSVIRSLGEAGLRVIAQEERGISSIDALGFHSRHVAERILTQSPRRSPGSFVDDILKAGDDGDVLIPVSLDSILAVASRMDEVQKRFRVALPPVDAIYTANDTERLLKVAERIGIRVPRTHDRVTGDDPEEILPAIKFPVVVKYREGEALGLPPDRRYAIVGNAGTFRRVYREMAARQASPLVQEYIRGDGWGMSAVMDAGNSYGTRGAVAGERRTLDAKSAALAGDERVTCGRPVDSGRSVSGRSKPVVFFCHRRIREYPATGGPSCFCESVYDPAMVDAGLRLLGELKWHGVAMVEFKRDYETGEFVLMEINPRFWGSLPLSAAAGANFPLALYRVALGESIGSHPAPGIACAHRSGTLGESRDVQDYGEAGESVDGRVPDYKVEVRMRYLFQDLLSVPGYLRRVPNRAAFLGGFLKDLLDPKVVDGVFRMDDPSPGFYYLARALFKRRG